MRTDKRPRAGLRLDDPIPAILLCYRGNVGQSVLIADIASDPFADRGDVFRRFGKEGLAARLLRKPAQHSGVLIAVLLVEDADRVDDCGRLLCHADNLRQAMLARVVAAVADQDQHFLVAIAQLEMLESGSYPIVQRGLADRLDSGEGQLQSIRPVCERHIRGKAKGYAVVEIDDKHLALGIAGAGKCQCRGNHIGAFRRHASAVIDKNADCNRDIFVAEVPDLLEHSILIDPKIVFAEPGNKRVAAVQNGCAQNHYVGIQLEGVFAARAALRWMGILGPGSTGQKGCGNNSNQAPERVGISRRNAHSGIEELWGMPARFSWRSSRGCGHLSHPSSPAIQSEAAALGVRTREWPREAILAHRLLRPIVPGSLEGQSDPPPN